jgi:hypothetical protein
MAFAQYFRFAVALGAMSGFAVSAAAEQPAGPPAAAQQTDEEETPTPAPLTVGSMAIASDAALSVDGMAVDVAIDRVTYAYKFKNTGATKLALSASVALPDLEVSNEGTTVYVLPSQTAENVIDLTVRSGGQVVRTTPYVQAVALGVDRLADLKAANIPLIPFGDAVEQALAGAKPETLAKLEGLGLLTPPDPAEPDTPVVADWSLHVVHEWTQTLDPKTATDVVVGFTPIKAVYTIDAASLGGFDALKEQVCLTPQVMAAAKTLLGVKGATADVVDITLANDGPARWLNNPAASVAVRKPAVDSIVVFCGMDPATQSQAVVKGTMAGGSEASGLRVLIMTRNAAK